MAASSYIDACRFNPTAGGTTDWTYSSAVQGYNSLAAANAVNGAQYSYRAESNDLSQWEIGTGAYNSSTGVLSRTTVLFNSSGTTSKISFSTTPQVAVVALAEDILPKNVTANITVSPSNPASITSTTPVMFGLGKDQAGSGAHPCSITPLFCTRVRFDIMGAVFNNAAGYNVNNLAIRYGTGTAPSNGAASTGTLLTNPVAISVTTNGGQTTFALAGIATGLTPGTAYWFDLQGAVNSNTGGVVSITGVAEER